MERRHFLKTGAFFSSGLLFGFSLTHSRAETIKSGSDEVSTELDALVHIAESNQVTILLNRIEMGQGISTGLPMLVAEEMDADWNLVTVQQAPVDETKFGQQNTTASISIHQGWQYAREAGARVRALLIKAAALSWQVAESQCFTNLNQVICNDGRVFTYGELVRVAAELPPVPKIELKSHSDMKLVGKSLPRLHLTDIISGKAKYGIDTNQTDLLVATIIKPPTRSSKLLSWTKPELKNQEQIVVIDSGLAVVGRNFWQVNQIAKTIDVKWSTPVETSFSNHSLRDSRHLGMKKKAVPVLQKGELTQARSAAEHSLELDYELPFLAHVTMEPVNATAYVTDSYCEITAPTQSPDKVHKDICELLGLTRQQVKVNVALLGGGFGRKTYRDFIIDAVRLAQKVERPVKLIYNRENDIQYDLFRPATSHKVKADFDNKGNIKAFDFNAAGPSILQFYQYPKVKSGDDTMDYLTFAGIDNFPYKHEAFSARAFTDVKSDGPAVGIMRSIGHASSCFVRETMMDIVATTAQQNPLSWRLKQLKGNTRATKVLQKAMTLLAATKGLTPNHFIGCALFEESWPKEEYYVCNVQIAVISKSQQRYTLTKMISVGDFGKVIHPDLVKNQMQGGVVFGMGMSLYDQITLKAGMAQESNFHDFRLPRIHEIPEIECAIIDNEYRPSGVGEKVVPATSPAICNAWFAATGEPVTSLPFKGLTLS